VGVETDAAPMLDEDDDLVDTDWAKPRRVNRLSWVLLAALLAVLAFVGGVAVQKSHDASLLATVARARTFGIGTGGGGGSGQGGSGGSGQGGSGGFGQGGSGQRGSGQGGSGQGGSGQGGSGQAGAGQGGSGQGSGSSGSGDGGGGASGATPVAVGTITSVSGQTMVVTDFGGNKITVTVPPTATVTTPGLTSPAVGAPVSVVGTKAADGSVTATAVTVRSSGG
jgi:hypothetical protein